MFNYEKIKKIQSKLDDMTKAYEVYRKSYYELNKSAMEFIQHSQIITMYGNENASSIFQREIYRIKEQRAQEAKEAEINALIKKALTDAGLVKPEKTKK